jgi:hypothetical protein
MDRQEFLLMCIHHTSQDEAILDTPGAADGQCAGVLRAGRHPFQTAQEHMWSSVIQQNARHWHSFVWFTH